jgi:polar amino acid transport system substrate-binding protein
VLEGGRVRGAAGGSAGGPLPPFDLDAIKARGTLRVIACEGEQPEEFSFKEGSKPGFEREIVQGFARLQHLKLEVVTVKGWDERIPALLRGDGDVIIGLTETEARRKLIDFTAETIPTRNVVVSHIPHSTVNSVDDLRREQVGVLKGTSWAQAAVDAGVSPARIESFDRLDTLLEALKTGKVGATVMSVSDFTLAAKRTPGLQAGVFLGVSGHQAWRIRKADKELAKAMNAYIENLRKTSSWSRLIITYFGEQALSVLGRARDQ